MGNETGTDASGNLSEVAGVIGHIVMKETRELRLREVLVWLLASPAGIAASSVVGRIPGLWNKVLLQPVLPPLKAAGIPALKQWVGTYPDTARILFSIALQYYESGDRVTDDRALACLRCSEWLGFESIERIVLYRALLAARSGDRDEFETRRSFLQPHDLSAQEQALMQHAELIVDRTHMARRARRGMPEPLVSDRPKRVLVVGDRDAVSARWFSESDYLLICPEVNGLAPNWWAARRGQFDTAFGSGEAERRTAEAGIPFERWHTVDFVA